MINKYLFNPDVIVEASNACDLKCQGCYAPNIFVSDDEDIIPSSYLSNKKLTEVLKGLELNDRVPSVSIRGGEPTLNPELSIILASLKNWFEPIFLETHGRWILEKDEKCHDILTSCQKTSTIIKISYDQMHGMRVNQLKEALAICQSFYVSFVVAITEFTFEEFDRTRNQCSWLSDSQIVYQKKVTNWDELIRPKIGVITARGIFNKNVTHR